MEVTELVESCLQTKEEVEVCALGLAADGEILATQSVLVSIKQFHAVREAVGDEIEMTLMCTLRLDFPDVVCSAARWSQPAPILSKTAAL